MKILNANKKDLEFDKNENIDEVKLSSNFKKSEYINAIEKVRDYIKQGDIYQANLTQRFSGKTNLSSYQLYKRLRDVSKAPFAAFLNS
ncbi:chorismate-binding protein [Paraclostridium bifermentans]|nr:chorismate-binding protein [Paraclostridium bifermentans]